MARTRAPRKPQEIPSALEVDPVAETIKPAQTMKVELTGGPMANNAKLLVDGKQVKKVTKAVIVADMELFRLQTEQIMIAAEVRVTVGSWEKNLLAKIDVYSEDDENFTSYLGRGETIREAIDAVLTQIEAKDAKVH